MELLRDSVSSFIVIDVTKVLLEAPSNKICYVCFNCYWYTNIVNVYSLLCRKYIVLTPFLLLNRII